MDDCDDKPGKAVVAQQLAQEVIGRPELRRAFSQLFKHPRSKPIPGDPTSGFSAKLKSVSDAVKLGDKPKTEELLTGYHNTAAPDDPKQLVLHPMQWKSLVKTFTGGQFKVLRGIEGEQNQPVDGKLKVGPFELAFLYHCLFRNKGNNEDLHGALHKMKFCAKQGNTQTIVSELTRIYNEHSPAERVTLDFENTGIIEAMVAMLVDDDFKSLEPYEGEPCLHRADFGKLCY
jgi:hypothetical protein